MAITHIKNKPLKLLEPHKEMVSKMNKKTKIFFKILMVFNPRGTSLYNMQKHWIPTKRNWTRHQREILYLKKK
jgi:hypothetical protein